MMNIQVSNPFRKKPYIKKAQKILAKVDIRESVVLLLLVLLVFTTVLYFREKMKMERLSNMSNLEIEKVIEKVGKLIILPRDPMPSVAIINDVKKLREGGSGFYENASNGDKLLIYPDQAILYNPEKDIIVSVVPIIPEIQNEEVEEE
ncbi:hypothetical protein ACFL13_01625 [Patescibacteria group bacterium]